jgi:hypothetical protein
MLAKLTVFILLAGLIGCSSGVEIGDLSYNRVDVIFKIAVQDEVYYSYMPPRAYVRSASDIVVFFIDTNGNLVFLDSMPSIEPIVQWHITPR